MAVRIWKKYENAIIFNEGYPLKKIINKSENVVEEMLQGMVKAHPEYLRRIKDSNVLVR